MAEPEFGGSIWARVLPPLSLLAVAGACVLFGLSTAPAEDPSGIAAGQAASLALPAWITAGLAVIAAVVLFFAGEDLVHRAGGILGLSASFGAAAGGVLNLVGYANSDIWWAANPAAIRAASGLLLVVAVIALLVVGSEQLRPGWRRRAP